jgi:uncharacterized membrane protein
MKIIIIAVAVAVWILAFWAMDKLERSSKTASNIMGVLGAILIAFQLAAYCVGSWQAGHWLNSHEHEDYEFQILKRAVRAHD